AVTIETFREPGTVIDEPVPGDWAAQVRELARQRDAVILAHNYQLPEIQEIAHHVGDSLGLSRVEAEADICCTSSNAVEVVASIPEDTPVLFCPDQFLGAHVQRELGRENMHIW